MPQTTHSTPSFSVAVYPAQALSVCNGANFGDALSVAGDLMPDDIYALASPAPLLRLSLSAAGADGALTIAADTGTGQPGAALHVDCCITLMNPMGQTCDVLVLVELDGHQRIAQVYALPLVPLVEKDEYSLSRSTSKARAPVRLKWAAPHLPGAPISPWQMVPNAELKTCARAIGF